MKNQDSIAKEKETSCYYKTPAGILQATFEDSVLVATSFIENKLANSHVLEAPSLPIMAMRGTQFQVKVWQAACKIPAGSTLSYKELALAIGKPTASRAVANALGSNKIAYFIPCHRVIHSDGTLSGYRWGVERKKMLLEAEKNTELQKSMSYYLNLPWTYTIETETDTQTNETLYIVSVNELPRVRTDAPTIQEAMELIKDAMVGAFRLYMEQGDEIPEPGHLNL